MQHGDLEDFAQPFKVFLRDIVQIQPFLVAIVVKLLELRPRDVLVDLSEVEVDFPNGRFFFLRDLGLDTFRGTKSTGYCFPAKCKRTHDAEQPKEQGGRARDEFSIHENLDIAQQRDDNDDQI